MDLQLFSTENTFIQNLDQDDALLGSYPVDDGCRIHVIDKSGAKAGEYEDLSRVEKYEISQEAYEKRTDSVRSFLKKNKVGKFNEEEAAQKAAEHERKLEEERLAAEPITPGSRCEVRVVGQPNKRGTVMYVGSTDFKPGIWVGVKYDEPLGKHDGSVEGQRYFTCSPKYGAFVKPQFVVVGDFPEEDYGLDDEM
ncbi:tubulin-folding cofactor B isoform X2 [Hyla sarda]|nr:tubulin-folding cofactor B isoform X2 [Hyla sarda]